jgi:hypothetical protein
VIGGESREVTMSTTELTKEEIFERYIDPIRAWAAQELEVSIPDPERVFV